MTLRRDDVRDDAARGGRRILSAFRTHWSWPLTAAVLPERLRFRLLSWVARSDRVEYPEESAAYAGATRFGFARLGADGAADSDEAAWQRAWRLVQLVDHFDLFSALLRTPASLTRGTEVVGAWPTHGPFLAITYHWGGGLGALAHLATGGRIAHFVSARFDRASLGFDPWRWRYAALRGRIIERASGGAIIYTGGASARIREAFAKGHCVIGLCDAVIDSDRSRLEAPFGSLSVSIPTGLLRLAVTSRVPVVSFAAGFDRATGRRNLWIDDARVFDDAGELARTLARRLFELVERDPPAWHMWPHAQRLLNDAGSG